MMSAFSLYLRARSTPIWTWAVSYTHLHSGDLALVHRQPDVASGELAVVLVAGEEGTLKRVIKKDGAVILQPFNQAYQPQVFIGEELEQLVIIGKVVETKTRW